MKTFTTMPSKISSENLIEDYYVISSNPLPEDWIMTLFARFDSIYDHAWSSKHQSELAWKITLLEWQEGLSGITGNQIKIALEKCRNGDFGRFPPNIADFRAACLGTYTGDSDMMFCAFLAKDFECPFIKDIYDHIGSWKFSNLPEKDLYKEFLRTYKWLKTKNIKYSQINKEEKVINNLIPYSKRVTFTICQLVALGVSIVNTIRDNEPDLSWPDITIKYINLKKAARQEFPLLDEFSLLKCLSDEVFNNYKNCIS